MTATRRRPVGGPLGSTSSIATEAAVLMPRLSETQLVRVANRMRCPRCCASGELGTQGDALAHSDLAPRQGYLNRGAPHRLRVIGIGAIFAQWPQRQKTREMPGPSAFTLNKSPTSPLESTRSASDETRYDATTPCRSCTRSQRAVDSDARG